jgi:hypothetical protein
MKTAKLVIAVGLLVLVVVSFTPMDFHEHICFHCRCEHETGTILGIPYTSYSPASMTRWYAARFPSHIHQWVHLGHIRNMGLGSVVVSSVGGRSMRMNPFWHVTEQEHFDFVKSATAVEMHQLTSHLAEHQHQEAVDLVLGKQTPPRVLCDNFMEVGSCRTPVVQRSAAVVAGNRTFCSPRCRDGYRGR